MLLFIMMYYSGKSNYNCFIVNLEIKFIGFTYYLSPFNFNQINTFSFKFVFTKNKLVYDYYNVYTILYTF